MWIMTLEEIYYYFAEMPVEDTAQVAEEIFNAIEAGHTAEQIKEINDILMQEGIDVSVKCRKKHPT